MKKRLLAVLLMLAMVTGLSACGNSSGQSSDSSAPVKEEAEQTESEEADAEADPFADGPSYTLRLGHVQAVTHPYHIGAVAFAEKVEELTNGKIKVEVFPSSQIGNEIDMIESMQMGTIDMGVIGTCNLANFDPSFTVFDLPFIFENRDHAIKVCESDFGQEKLDGLSEYGLVGLGYFDNGFFDVMNNKVDVYEPSDLKGLNIRIVQNPVYSAAFTACGANPVPMAPTEVYTALQNGTVDGNCLSINGIYGFGWYELQTTYTLADMFFCNLVLTMSKSVYDEMPEAYQAAIREAAAYGCEMNHTSGAEQEEVNLKAMEESGIKAIYPENLDSWIELMEKEVYPQFSDIASQEDIDLIKSMK